jgi:hypothetical protein
MEVRNFPCLYNTILTFDSLTQLKVESANRRDTNLVLLSEFVVDGNELLAVSAPGSVELDQDVLLGVHRNLNEVLANQNLIKCSD